jgi:hypothetical protein
MKKLKLLLLSLVLFGSSSCGDGPEVTVCLMDVRSGQLVCSDPQAGTVYIPFAEADGFIVMKPDDFKRVLDYIKLKCRK